jgi:hypothetical protein
MDAVGNTNCHDRALPVVPAAILYLERGTVENESREFEIETSLAQIRFALRKVQLKAHNRVYPCIYSDGQLALATTPGGTITSP